MKRLPVLSVAVLALASLGACIGDSRRDPRELTLALRADVTGFFPNPSFSDESYTIYLNQCVFEGLVGVGANHEPVPAVAEGWEQPDDTTWLFHVRRGLKFNDGTNVTPADVVASLNASRERGWFDAGNVNVIESVRGVGPSTVEVKTKEPYPALLYKLPYTFILPERVMGMKPVPSVGTGPYVLESWEPKREIRFKRNPHGRSPGPGFAKVRILVVPDAETRITMVVTGKADMADEVPSVDVPRLRNVASLEVISRPSGRVVFLAPRADRKPFDDIRVREALDKAIDREELIRRALPDMALPASQIVSPTVVGFDPSITPPKPDREAARRLLREAGYPNGFDVTLDGPSNRYVNDVEVLHEVARQLALVGMRVAVNPVEKGAFYRLIESGKSSIYLFGWACELGEASEALDELMHSPTKAMLGASNFQGIADADLDALIEAGDRTVTPDDRAEVYRKALARIAQKRLVVPLETQIETYVLSRRIRWEPPLNLALDVKAIS
ncbi:MAG TPA: ABC transporter substrate-binding protein, partial [Thermoanaerobaculia bacterium]|nr:ABC transporter substrate-binding protein [Thermoanaerobaculia bacterium]